MVVAKEPSQKTESDALPTSPDTITLHRRASCRSPSCSKHANMSGSQPTSIYDLLSQNRRNWILFAAAVATMLVPFCDTVGCRGGRQLPA